MLPFSLASTDSTDEADLEDSLDFDLFEKVVGLAVASFASLECCDCDDQLGRGVYRKGSGR